MNMNMTQNQTTSQNKMYFGTSTWWLIPTLFVLVLVAEK